ncbi:MAG: NADH-ubiquinone dehydrogenase, partial [Ahrensia sp.]
LMPEDFVKPKAIAKPAVADDLKLISGVGPKLETVLNGLGIWTFAQIMAWTPAEVAWVDDFLQFKGRIDRDNWIAQAQVLAAGK